MPVTEGKVRVLEEDRQTTTCQEYFAQWPQGLRLDRVRPREGDLCRIYLKRLDYSVGSTSGTGPHTNGKTPGFFPHRSCRRICSQLL